MKKKIIISSLVAIIAICTGVFCYVHHSNQVKAERLKVYKKALFDFRVAETKLMYGTKFMVRDYVANWHGCISNGKALDKNNVVVDCDDVDKALSVRCRFYIDFGANEIIDSTYNVLGKKLDVIKKNADEEQSDVVKNCQNIFDELNNAITLVKEPSGTYMEYSSNTNACFQKLSGYDRLLKQKVKINYDDIEGTGVIDLTDFAGRDFLENRTPKKGKKIKLSEKEFARTSTLMDISWRLQNVDY